MKHNVHYQTFECLEAAPPRDYRYGLGVRGLPLVGLLLAVCGSWSCDHPQAEKAAARTEGPASGTSEVAPASPELSATAGQTIYVPAYSAVATSNNSQLYQLAITLSVRNTDERLPIIVTSVRYHNQDGQLVRNYLEKPLRVKPLAALEFFVREGDTRGGTAANFLVEWVGEPTVRAPIVETVMIGISSSQAISFTCPGRIVAERGR